MSDPNDLTSPIVVSNSPGLASAVSTVRTLLVSAAAIVGVLHFPHVAATLNVLSGQAGPIVNLAVAAAGLASLIYGAFSRWRIQHKAKDLANLLTDDVAVTK